MSHKAGFVSIIGKPNAGKSTLMNALVGEKMSIITPKAQTTRHRIIGIVNDENHQIVFSDTPGVIKPNYSLQESMMNFVQGSLIDADIILFVTDINEKYDENDVIEKLRKTSSPVAVLINKIDKSTEEDVKAKIEFWKEKLNPDTIFAISALLQHNVVAIMEYIKEKLPEHAPYYEKDELTDKSMRFFVSEMIREKVFKLYDKEIPYSTEVIITSYKEEPKITRIAAEIIVERDSQKNILIGKAGEMIKKVGTYARQDIEEFIGGKVFLEIFVKVIPDWRSKKNYLKRFGYDD
ncbi:ribosome biogenesis GTPase Era [Sphingobacterium spiritivorum ATCC 33300]|uniref:GTPase Era n=1 Tax=Sphingobacterium spiritivorum ATCC 33300 TaxID=525372 RepID=C2FWT2_SPHSI|nr:GTPase Era [Sphingobacterium spiritivorum]EEI92611.1 ribosome biogenesis GTPase Era [Sphingobacterium spiritivorum ATCC 33300]QQS94112.1 GTPase Era [Sphingobacterium spiritivorum]